MRKYLLRIFLACLCNRCLLHHELCLRIMHFVLLCTCVQFTLRRKTLIRMFQVEVTLWMFSFPMQWNWLLYQILISNWFELLVKMARIWVRSHISFSALHSWISVCYTANKFTPNNYHRIVFLNFLFCASNVHLHFHTWYLCKFHSFLRIYVEWDSWKWIPCYWN